MASHCRCTGAELYRRCADFYPLARIVRADLHGKQAIEHILPEQQVLFVQELGPNVLRCVKDANGNHVSVSTYTGAHLSLTVNNRSFRSSLSTLRRTASLS